MASRQGDHGNDRTGELLSSCIIVKATNPTVQNCKLKISRFCPIVICLAGMSSRAHARAAVVSILCSFGPLFCSPFFSGIDHHYSPPPPLSTTVRDKHSVTAAQKASSAKALQLLGKEVKCVRRNCRKGSVNVPPTLPGKEGR